MPPILKQTLVVGVDEAGRGSLAGPVVAAAVLIKDVTDETGILKQFPILNYAKSSKELTPQKREQIFQALEQCPDICFATAKVGHKVIDQINILQASKLAMTRAVRALEREVGERASFLMIDGNFGINIKREQQAIIRGDERIFLIKLASIAAKVTRDKIMINYYHRKFPGYGFAHHKGYATRSHLQKLCQLGPCSIHRKTFQPVAALQKDPPSAIV